MRFSPRHPSTPIHCHAFLFLCLTLLCLLSQAGCDSQSANPGNLASEAFDPNRWITVEEPTLGFRSKFPGKWKHRTQFMQMPQGSATVHIFEYWHIAFQYGITVTRLPPGVSDLRNPNRVLDYAVQSIIDEHGGTLTFQENRNVGGFSARRARITLSESYLKSAQLNTLIVLRDNLVYRISTAGVGNHEHIEFFLNSFETIPIQW
ncbi:MAG: hypothetical protein ABQ298_03305 [Puniceicoccaceae bacterium]